MKKEATTPKKHLYTWMKEEIEFIKNNLSKPSKELAKNLNRTIGAIEFKKSEIRKQLGIGRTYNTSIRRKPHTRKVARKLGKEIGVRIANEVKRKVGRPKKTEAFELFTVSVNHPNWNLSKKSKPEAFEAAVLSAGRFVMIVKPNGERLFAEIK